MIIIMPPLWNGGHLELQNLTSFVIFGNFRRAFMKNKSLKTNMNFIPTDYVQYNAYMERKGLYLDMS